MLCGNESGLSRAFVQFFQSLELRQPLIEGVWMEVVDLIKRERDRTESGERQLEPCLECPRQTVQVVRIYAPRLLSLQRGSGRGGPIPSAAEISQDQQFEGPPPGWGIG